MSGWTRRCQCEQTAALACVWCDPSLMLVTVVTAPIWMPLFGIAWVLTRFGKGLQWLIDRLLTALGENPF